MVRIGDGEHYYEEHDDLTADFVTATPPAEEDPFAALDDFAAEGNGPEPAVAADLETEPDSTGADATAKGQPAASEDTKAKELKPQLKQLTPEEIQRIAEKNKREKKLAHKNVLKIKKTVKKAAKKKKSKSKPKKAKKAKKAKAKRKKK